MINWNKTDNIKLLFRDRDINMKNRAGEFQKNLTGELKYKSLLPSPLPPKPPLEIDEELDLSYNARANVVKN